VAGAHRVLLFTDLANPTSNALYQRLGYEPLEDRAIWTFRRSPAGGDAGRGGWVRGKGVRCGLLDLDLWF